MDKIWYRNPSKSEVIGVVAGMKKTEWQKIVYTISNIETWNVSQKVQF